MSAFDPKRTLPRLDRLSLFQSPQLKSGLDDGRLNHVAAQIVGRHGVRANDANCVPRSKLLRQFVAILIVREGAQVRTFVSFENKDSHGSVLADTLGRLSLTVGVEPRLFARGRDCTVKNCLFASSFTEPPDRVAFLASCLLGGFFVKAPPFHFTED